MTTEKGVNTETLWETHAHDADVSDNEPVPFRPPIPDVAIDSSSAHEDEPSSLSDSESELEPEILVPIRPPPEHGTAKCSQILSRCWYVVLHFGTTPVRFLLDSGSEVTIISKAVYESTPSLQQPVGLTTWKISGIGDNTVPVRGSITLPLNLGDYRDSLDAIIADISTPGILGMNFLERPGISVNFGKGTLTVGGNTYLLQRKRSPRSFHLKVAETTVLKPHSETVVYARPLHEVSQLMAQCVVYVTEPVRDFTLTTGAILGRSLVRADITRVPLLLINTTANPITLARGTVTGRCVPTTAIRDPETDNPSKVVHCNQTSIGDSCSSPLPDHLETLVPKDGLTESEKQQVRSLVGEFSALFLPPGGKPGRTGMTRHRIQLTDDTPIKQQLRRVPIAHQERIDKELQKAIDAGAAVPSESPWASPVVMARKKDGTWRFCVDYRKLNNVTKKDSYPLPNIDDTFDALVGTRYFSAIDLASGYWQVEMEPRDIQKTAFITKRGLFEWNVMPYGLCNAPATFERLMERVLRGHLGKRCLVYLDDVIIHGTTFDTAMSNLRLVFERLKDAGMTLKPAKCKLFQRELLYLGFIVTGEGLKPDPEKLKKVTEWPRPCTAKDVRSFLGFASYHRRFIKISLLKRAR